MKKSHFLYGKRQRNGILLLAVLIASTQLVYFFVDFPTSTTTTIAPEELLRFQQQIDSLSEKAMEDRKPKIYPFNPSFITDFRGYQLGLSTTEIDRLLKHRSEGKYINSVKEFQQVSGVSDSLLKVISPYFKFPDWVVKKQQEKVTNKAVPQKKAVEQIVVKDINKATATDFKQIHGVGDRLAGRIVNYRNKLGGFLIEDQLYEVYYLDKEVADRILERFKILAKPEINKVNINEASFKEVLRIVYIDYELTKKIFNYRDEVAEIQNLEELKEIEGFPIDKYERIALYLQVD